ncbi:hypothetical protein B296_00015972 [Ensete ventricosum]|uniref:Uncharacterized protein n=1 Tax=Ensete ventricosum TaxID=4639 RepID=A0A426YK63_ENSVE|nr:hypothetical protein B296_00015972 [Ensete ventricosum]
MRLKMIAEGGVNLPSKEENEQPTTIGGGRSTRHCPPEEEGRGCMAAMVAGEAKAVESSLGDSSKESGSSLGTRREIAGKKIEGLVARLPEVAGVCGS